MMQPGRKYSVANTQYRYGFNGKELDKEMSANTTYDYGFRIYNPALGRFLSVDPLTKSYPWYTPYQFAGNTPIQAIDLDGKEEYHYSLAMNKNGSSTLRLQSIKYNNEHNWLGFKFKTKIETKRAIVEYKSEKYYIGFAGTYGRGNEDMFSTFLLWKSNPDAKAFESLFYSESESYKGAEDMAIEQNRDMLYSMLSNTFVVNADGTSHLVGSKGTQLSSTTVWNKKGSATERIDVENPSPGKRAGSLHYQDENNVKYQYNINDKKFYQKDANGEFSVEAPKSVQKMLENKNFQRGIDKGLRYLGEKTQYDTK